MINEFCIKCFGLSTPIGIESSPIDFTFSPCMITIYLSFILFCLYLIYKFDKEVNKNDK